MEDSTFRKAMAVGTHRDGSTIRSLWICGAALVAPLMIATAADAVPITVWDFDGAELQQAEEADGPVWVDSGEPTTVDGTPVINGIHLYGTGPDEDGGFLTDRAFSITGADYVPSESGDPEYQGMRLLLHGDASIDGAAWDSDYDIITTDFGFGYAVSGGTIQFYEIQTSFDLPQAGFGVGSGTGLPPDEGPVEKGFGFQFIDGFGADISSVTFLNWEVRFLFTWTDMAPTDTLNFYIPQNSVDIQATSIPEPASLALAGLGGLALLRRRR